MKRWAATLLVSAVCSAVVHADVTIMQKTTMDVGGTQMPPEAAAAMQGITMVMAGSLWVTKDAPGAAEYRDYQKALSAADLATAAMGATGINMPGADKLTKAMASVDGLPILTE